MMQVYLKSSSLVTPSARAIFSIVARVVSFARLNIAHLRTIKTDFATDVSLRHVLLFANALDVLPKFCRWRAHIHTTIIQIIVRYHNSVIYFNRCTSAPFPFPTFFAFRRRGRGRSRTKMQRKRRGMRASGASARGALGR